MEIPEVHAMARVNWQIFGTLTFKNARHSHESRMNMWFALTRTLCRWANQIPNVPHVHFPDLLWVLRIEQGEAYGRTHFHCLIGGLPLAAVSGGGAIFQRKDGSWDVGNRTTHALEAKWGRMGLHPSDKQRRISRFSLYDKRLNGFSYVLKCLEVEEGRFLRDLYETSKFGWSGRQLILSESMSRLMEGIQGTSACSRRRILRAAIDSE